MNEINLAIVDDEELFRTGLNMVVSSFTNVQVSLEASDGQDLLTQLQSRKQVPDIVLLDLKMKGMDGVETASHLGQLYPDIKIIVLSLHFTTPMVRHMIGLNVAAYIKKSANPDQLEKAINKVYHEGIYFTPEIYEILRKGYVTANHSRPTFRNEDNLSPREAQVLELICKEYTNPEIAELLSLSPKTIAGHRNAILQKTKSKNTAGLVVYAIVNDFVSIRDLTEFKLKARH